MTIEVAGPSIPLITISRVDIAEMAFWVIDQCVVRENGLGGFVTKGIHRLIRYTMNPATVLTNPYRKSNSLSLHPPLQHGDPRSCRICTTAALDTYFMTLTISDTKAPGYGPGDNDPSVALAIASHNRLMNRNKNTHNSPAALKAEADEKAWTEQANRMGRGNNIPWWDFDPDAATHDEMNYECDANLGRPSRVDCTQIEWNQLTPASDTLTVGPGNALFLHSNTCYLAVSASIGIVLSWNQVRTAVAALTAMCVQAPFGPPQGGRAYHRPSAARPRIGRRSQNRDKLTGRLAVITLPEDITDVQLQVGMPSRRMRTLPFSSKWSPGGEE